MGGRGGLPLSFPPKLEPWSCRVVCVKPCPALPCAWALPCARSPLTLGLGADWHSQTAALRVRDSEEESTEGEHTVLSCATHTWGQSTAPVWLTDTFPWVGGCRGAPRGTPLWLPPPPVGFF